MTLKESLQTPHDAEMEVQRVITGLIEQTQHSDKMIEEERYIKAYKREEKMVRELAWLMEHLNDGKAECKEELSRIKESLSISCFKKKRELIQASLECSEYDENEDFGEE